MQVVEHTKHVVITQPAGRTVFVLCGPVSAAQRNEAETDNNEENKKILDAKCT